MEEEFYDFLEYAKSQIDDSSDYKMIENLIKLYLMFKSSAKSDIYMQRLKKMYKTEDDILKLFRKIAK